MRQQHAPSPGYNPPVSSLGLIVKHPLTVEQRDGLQYLIEEAHKKGVPKYLDPVRIGHRLLILNFVSMHTTSFTLANALVDLFSQNPDIGIVEDLREECVRVLTESGGIWTQDAVSKLYRVDSVIRESMRVSSFSILALPRRVSIPPLSIL